MARVVYAICVIVGSGLFGWIAELLGAGYFSAWGIIASGIGAIVGVYVGYKINCNFMGS